MWRWISAAASGRWSFVGDERMVELGGDEQKVDLDGEVAASVSSPMWHLLDLDSLIRELPAAARRRGTAFDTCFGLRVKGQNDPCFLDGGSNNLK
jgi:hypothetical protein